MHEIGLMETTLSIALEHANQQNAKKIHKLQMQVGVISGVAPEALEFAFDVIIKGTIAEGAELQIETIPVTCYCPSCQLDFQPVNFFYECPNCYQMNTSIIRGKELALLSLEMS